ncbi:hypothetical protein ACJX0J_031595, partial [Zea mays]
TLDINGRARSPIRTIAACHRKNHSPADDITYNMLLAGLLRWTIGFQYSVEDELLACLDCKEIIYHKVIMRHGVDMFKIPVAQGKKTQILKWGLGICLAPMTCSLVSLEARYNLDLDIWYTSKLYLIDSAYTLARPLTQHLGFGLLWRNLIAKLLTIRRGFLWKGRTDIRGGHC